MENHVEGVKVSITAERKAGSFGPIQRLLGVDIYALSKAFVGNRRYKLAQILGLQLLLYTGLEQVHLRELTENACLDFKNKVEHCGLSQET
jgi:hypothetical protein